MNLINILEKGNSLFGEHAFEVWKAGIIWSLIAILFVKMFYLVRAKDKIKFNLKFWFNDNILDIIFGLFASLVILRLGDYVIELLRNKFSFEIPETTDFVVYMIVISGAIQVYLHKKRKPVSKAVEEQMHKENDL